jgi:hypothetical protein
MTTAIHDPLALTIDMLGDLHRLVEAIDLRVPRPERAGEGRIASDAAELRARAVVLIEKIEAAAAAAKAAR